MATGFGKSGSAVYRITEGDTKPDLEAQLTEGQTASDITGNTSVTFTMRRQNIGTVKVNAAAAVVDDASTGLVHYEWTSNDTDEPGIYEGKFQVNFSGGNRASYPSDVGEYILVIVQDDVA